MPNGNKKGGLVSTSQTIQAESEKHAVELMKNLTFGTDKLPLTAGDVAYAELWIGDPSLGSVLDLPTPGRGHWFVYEQTRISEIDKPVVKAWLELHPRLRNMGVYWCVTNGHFSMPVYGIGKTINGELRLHHGPFPTLVMAMESAVESGDGIYELGEKPRMLMQWQENRWA